MTRAKHKPLQDELVFQNVSERGLSLDDVQARILSFMAKDPKAVYHFIVGTDSQVYRGCTKFVTGIIIRRVGRGAWACYRQTVVPRELRSLKEKLSYETTLSQEVASYFMGDALRKMEEIVLPYIYKGAALEHFIDIDAGTHPTLNKTSRYVKEMIDRIEAMGVYAARVKPESYAASSYANRYTKKSV